MKRLFTVFSLLAGLSQCFSRADDVSSAAVLPKVNVTASDSIAFKNISSGAFTIYRDGTNGALAVKLLISGTASNGVDIAKLPDTVTIPPGFHAVSLQVLPVISGDNVPDKWVRLTVSTNADYTVGSHARATVNIRENAFENQAPVVSITSPAEGASFPAHANVAIAADASDADGDLTKVTIIANDDVLGRFAEKPYSLVWSNVSAGKYALYVRAEDKLGKSTLSAPVHITVTNVPPVSTLAITSPAAGSVFPAGTNLKLEASGGTNNGALKSVSFYEDNKLLGTVTAAPFSLVWSNVAPGSYRLKAKGVENSGANVSSAQVRISVTNPAPKVSITAPANNSVVGVPGAITIQAEATASNNGVDNVMFFANNRFLATVKTAPYTYSWTNAAPGKHSLLAKVTDQFGESASSSVVQITVTNPPPKVSLTAPTNGASLKAPAQLELKADASDADGIRSVSFYNGRRLIGSTTKAPYSLALKDLHAPGTYTFTAVAVDTYYQTTTSSEVKITVTK